MRFQSLLIACLFAALSCVNQNTSRGASNLMPELRALGSESTDSDTVARWLLSEMLSPGGTAANASKARARLDKIKAHSMRASLARGIDDSFHGRLKTAPDHFLQAVADAQHSKDADAPLIAWVAAQSALQLKDASAGLWDRWGAWVESAIAQPGKLGWRARASLLNWWLSQSWQQAKGGLQEVARERFGCVKNLRLAGPFGNPVPSSTYRHFPAETPGPWPARWPRESTAPATARILKTTQEGCSVKADEVVADGIFYAESYLTLATSSDVILVAPGAYALWIDDALALSRDIRTWGAGLKAGVAVRLSAGRHRVLLRVSSKDVSLRVLKIDGSPLGVTSSVDASLPYSTAPFALLPDPNLLSAFIHNGDVAAPKDDLIRYCAAFLAQIEGQADVAAALHEPLVQQAKDATGPALYLAAIYTEGDPIFDRSQTSDLMRELNQRAVTKDPGLWAAELDLISKTASSKGLTEAVGALASLQGRFSQVPGVGVALANVYGQLGWKVEYNSAIKALEQQFPENLEILHSAAEVYKQEGDHAAVDRILGAIRKLDPDSEISLNQALEREDYEAALQQLRALAARRPERKGTKKRIEDLQIRVGQKSESATHLKSLIADDPTDSSLHLSLADLLFSQGDRAALHKTLASAVESGADQAPLVDAIDLVEGMTELQPYRLDAKKLIAQYEQAGKQLPGTAARVLDYSVVWVRADGSSRMLEHELVRIQSAEAISKFAEQKLDGLILNMRVIKKDGRTLEPEPVAGKPSFTFPHLEEGDYVETEQIQFMRGDPSGKEYNGPRWFFREENIAYARSELVLISPTNQPIQIETRGDVPQPEITRDGEFVTRRWRVDHSPAAPDEPFSAPITEFLPSVSVGWGLSLEQNIADLNTRVSETIPIDPRLTRIARRIVDGIAPRAQRDRALAVYRWVQANIAEGEESDGRRVVMGKSGNRWQAMVTLCRSLGIQAQFVIAKSRLAPPTPGPITRAQEFGAAVLRVNTNSGPVWLTLDDKYAPFGYLPAEVRGMPGFALGLDKPVPVILPDDGSQDSITFSADVDLAASGTAELTLVQTFRGKPAVQLRKGLAELPENRLHDVLEAQLLGRSLHGARLKKFKILRATDADAPLSIEMQATVPAFAQLEAGGLRISPPYVLQLSQLSTLSTRQTPLLIMETTHQIVNLRIKLPPGAKVSPPNELQLEQEGRKVSVSDRIKDGHLILQREVVIPAGRIQPDGYTKLVEFARAADDAQAREIIVALPSR